MTLSEKSKFIVDVLFTYQTGFMLDVWPEEYQKQIEDALDTIRTSNKLVGQADPYNAKTIAKQIFIEEVFNGEWKVYSNTYPIYEK